MEIIEWDVDDIQQTVDSLDDLILANNFIRRLKNKEIDVDDIKTEDAIAICKIRLFGEYNALLVREMEEYLCDAEVYVITWDGEASDGGEMFKLDDIKLREIIDGTVFGGTGDF